jgi:hypothetical protein
VVFDVLLDILGLDGNIKLSTIYKIISIRCDNIGVALLIGLNSLIGIGKPLLS